MRIFEITGFIDKAADVMADPKADPIESLSNEIKNAGHQVKAQVIELLRADLNIKAAPAKNPATTQPAPATTQPAPATTQPAPATTQPAPTAKPAV
jgi:hypothetical protein